MHRFRERLNNAKYPRTFQAIDALSETIVAEFDNGASQATLKRSQKITSVASLKRSLRYARKMRLEAKNALKAHEATRVGLHIQDLWHVRVGISDPCLPCRKMADFLEDFSAGGQPPSSHTTICAVRDAFAELIKKFNRVELVRMMEDMLPTNDNAQESKPIFIHHLHDEASMRFKSSVVNEVEQPLRRGRSSKIQNNVVRIAGGGHSMEFLTELQPILRKDAATIAHALLMVCREICEQLVLGLHDQKHGCCCARVVHLIAGDGINTNGAAMRRLMRKMWSLQTELKVRYSIVSWTCASHASNLVVVVAICGRIIGKPTENSGACGACVRLYKYLIPDYIEEFSASLQLYIARTLQLFDTPPPRAGLTAAEFQNLYGDVVMPDDVVRLYNGSLGVGKMQHVIMQNSRGAAGEEDLLLNVQQRFFLVLYRWILQMEERPVVTRFFLFAKCVAGLLRLLLLGIPTSVFSTQWVRPRKENQKRLQRFRAYMDDASTPQELRVACLCLQLTEHATSITSQKPKPGEVPLLVRLGQREIQRKTGAQLASIIPKLTMDPDLDCARALYGLLVTEAHIYARFEEYARYPTRVWKLTREFNRDYMYEIEYFLTCDESELDAGYSLPLRQAAMKGDVAAAISMLASDDIQEELVGILVNGPSSTLDCERKHYSDRKSETVKVTGVARASRNSLLMNYQRGRRERVRAVRAVKKDMKNVKFMSVSA